MRVFLEESDLCLDAMPEHEVILVEAADVGALGLVQGEIKHPAEAAVARKRIEMDVVVFFLELVADLLAFVCRTVVHEEDLIILVGALADGTDGILEIGGAVEDRYDD